MPCRERSAFGVGGSGHGEPVRYHDGQPAVVVPKSKLSVRQVDLAHVRQPRQVFDGREDGLDDALADPQHVAHRRVFVVLLRQRGVERLVCEQLPLAVGEHHEREPGCGRWRIVRLHRAFVRQCAPAKHDLR